MTMIKMIRIMFKVLMRTAEVPGQVRGSPKVEEVSKGQQQLSLCRAHSDKPSLWGCIFNIPILALSPLFDRENSDHRGYSI